MHMSLVLTLSTLYITYWHLDGSEEDLPYWCHQLFFSPTCLHSRWAKILSATEISLLNVLNQFSFDSISELAWNATAISIGFYCHPIIPETECCQAKKGSLCFVVVSADILIVQSCSGTLISSASLAPCHSWVWEHLSRVKTPLLGCCSHPDEAEPQQWWPYTIHTVTKLQAWELSYSFLLIVFFFLSFPIIFPSSNISASFFVLRFSMISIILSIFLPTFSQRPLPRHACALGLPHTSHSETLCFALLAESSFLDVFLPLDLISHIVGAHTQLTLLKRKGWEIHERWISKSLWI